MHQYCHRFAKCGNSCLYIGNNDNEFDAIYEDKHVAISTNGFTTPPQFTNLMNIVSSSFVSMHRLVACMNECRIVCASLACFNSELISFVFPIVWLN
jgi:hypothetical protein